MTTNNADSFGNTPISLTTLPCGAVVETLIEETTVKEEVVGDETAPCLLSFYRSDKIKRYGERDSSYTGGFGFDSFDSDVVAQADIVQYERIKKILPKRITINKKDYKANLYLCPILSIWSLDQVKSVEDIENEMVRENLETLSAEVESADKRQTKEKESVTALNSKMNVTTDKKERKELEKEKQEAENDLSKTTDLLTLKRNEEALIKQKLAIRVGKKKRQTSATLTFRLEETLEYDKLKGEKPKKFKIRLKSSTNNIKMSFEYTKKEKVEGKEKDVTVKIEKQTYGDLEMSMNQTQQVTILCIGSFDSLACIEANLMEVDGKKAPEKPLIGKLNIKQNNKIYWAQLLPVVVSDNPSRITIDDETLVSDLNNKSMNQAFIHFTLLPKCPLPITTNEISQYLDRENKLSRTQRTGYNTTIKSLYEQQMEKGPIAKYTTQAEKKAFGSKIFEKTEKFLKKFKSEINFDIKKEDFFYIKDKFENACCTKAWQTFFVDPATGKTKNKQKLEYDSAKINYDYIMANGAEELAKSEIENQETKNMKNEKLDLDTRIKNFKNTHNSKITIEEKAKIEQQYKKELDNRVLKELNRLKNMYPPKNEAPNTVKMYITDIVDCVKGDNEKEYVPGYSETGDGTCHIMKKGLESNGVLIHELGHALSLKHIFWDVARDKGGNIVPEPVFMYHPDSHSGEIKQDTLSQPAVIRSSETSDKELTELEKNIGTRQEDIKRFNTMEEHYKKDASKKRIPLTQQEKYNLFNLWKLYNATMVYLDDSIKYVLTGSLDKLDTVIAAINQEIDPMTLKDKEAQGLAALNFPLKSSSGSATTKIEDAKDYTGYVQLRTWVDRGSSKENYMDYDSNKNGGKEANFEYKSFHQFQCEEMQNSSNLTKK